MRAPSDGTHGEPERAKRTPVKVLCHFGRKFREVVAACAGVPGVRVVATADLSELAREITDAHVLVTGNRYYSEAVAEITRGKATQLEWIHFISAGTDAATRHGVPKDVITTSAGSAWAPVVAEHAFALLLGLVRRLHELERARTRQEWLQEGLHAGLATLRSRTLLILGMGSIGREVARRAKAFDMRVIGVARTAREEVHADRLVTIHELSEVLPQADAVVVALPLTEETTGLVGREALALLQPSALLVNVARGEIVDEAALLEALTAGRLAGAGLDVFEGEPLPGDSPFWRLENVILSPHVAGFGDPDVAQQLAADCRENLALFLAGEPLRNRVDLP